MVLEIGGRTWRGLLEVTPPAVPGDPLSAAAADPGGVRAMRGRELNATLYSEALGGGRERRRGSASGTVEGAGMSLFSPTICCMIRVATRSYPVPGVGQSS